MGDLFFFIKMLILTVITVICLQVKIGTITVGERIGSWAQTSSLVGKVQEVADGAVIVISRIYRSIAASGQGAAVAKVEEYAAPGSRLNVSLERSKEFLREQAAKVSKKVSKKVSSELENSVQGAQNRYLEEYLPIVEQNHEDHHHH